MTYPASRWLKLAALLLVPLLLYAVLAERASWRPRVLHFSDEAMAVAYSPDGHWLGCASLSQLELRDAQTEQIVWREKLAYDSNTLLRRIAFSPDSQTLAISLNNFPPGLQLWDVTTRKLRHDLLAHHRYSDNAGTLHFMPDAARLITGGCNSSHISITAPLRLWDIGTGQLLDAHKPITKFPIDLLALSSDGRTLALRMLDAKKTSYVSLRALATGRAQCALYPSAAAYCAAFTPDYKTIAVGTVNGKIMLWDIATRRWISHWQAHISKVYGLAFSPDGRYLVSNDMYTVKLWDARQRKYLRTLTEAKGFIDDLAFSPDSTTLAVACEKNIVQLWRIQ